MRTPTHSHAHTQDAESVMHDCEQLFKCKLEPVVASAVKSWSLLLSIAQPHNITPIVQRLDSTQHGSL